MHALVVEDEKALNPFLQKGLMLMAIRAVRGTGYRLSDEHIKSVSIRGPHPAQSILT
jgi:hypothetical protein